MGKSLVSCFFLRHSVFMTSCTDVHKTSSRVTLWSLLSQLPAILDPPSDSSGRNATFFLCQLLAAAAQTAPVTCSQTITPSLVRVDCFNYWTMAAIFYLIRHFVLYTGKSWPEKVSKVREKMSEKKAVGLVVTALDEIAWLLNLRGSDISYNPVFFAYVIVTTDSVMFVS